MMSHQFTKTQKRIILPHSPCSGYFNRRFVPQQNIVRNSKNSPTRHNVDNSTRNTTASSVKNHVDNAGERKKCHINISPSVVDSIPLKYDRANNLEKSSTLTPESRPQKKEVNEPHNEKQSSIKQKKETHCEMYELFEGQTKEPDWMKFQENEESNAQFRAPRVEDMPRKGTYNKYRFLDQESLKKSLKRKHGETSTKSLQTKNKTQSASKKQREESSKGTPILTTYDKKGNFIVVSEDADCDTNCNKELERFENNPEEDDIELLSVSVDCQEKDETSDNQETCDDRDSTEKKKVSNDELSSNKETSAQLTQELSQQSSQETPEEQECSEVLSQESSQGSISYDLVVNLPDETCSDAESEVFDDLFFKYGVDEQESGSISPTFDSSLSPYLDENAKNLRRNENRTENTVEDIILSGETSSLGSSSKTIQLNKNDYVTITSISGGEGLLSIDAETALQIDQDSVTLQECTSRRPSVLMGEIEKPLDKELSKSLSDSLLTDRNEIDIVNKKPESGRSDQDNTIKVDEAMIESVRETLKVESSVQVIEQTRHEEETTQRDKEVTEESAFEPLGKVLENINEKLQKTVESRGEKSHDDVSEDLTTCTSCVNTCGEPVLPESASSIYGTLCIKILTTKMAADVNKSNDTSNVGACAEVGLKTPRVVTKDSDVEMRGNNESPHQTFSEVVTTSQGSMSEGSLILDTTSHLLKQQPESRVESTSIDSTESQTCLVTQDNYLDPNSKVEISESCEAEKVGEVFNDSEPTNDIENQPTQVTQDIDSTQNIDPDANASSNSKVDISKFSENKRLSNLLEDVVKTSKVDKVGKVFQNSSESKIKVGRTSSRLAKVSKESKELKTKVEHCASSDSQAIDFKDPKRSELAVSKFSETEKIGKVCKESENSETKLDNCTTAESPTQPSEISENIGSLHVSQDSEMKESKASENDKVSKDKEKSEIEVGKIDETEELGSVENNKTSEAISELSEEIRSKVKKTIAIEKLGEVSRLAKTSGVSKPSEIEGKVSTIITKPVDEDKRSDAFETESKDLTESKKSGVVVLETSQALLSNKTKTRTKGQIPKKSKLSKIDAGAVSKELNESELSDGIQKTTLVTGSKKDSEIPSQISEEISNNVKVVEKTSPTEATPPFRETVELRKLDHLTTGMSSDSHIFKDTPKPSMHSDAMECEANVDNSVVNPAPAIAQEILEHKEKEKSDLKSAICVVNTKKTPEKTDNRQKSQQETETIETQKVDECTREENCLNGKAQEDTGQLTMIGDVEKTKLFSTLLESKHGPVRTLLLDILGFASEKGVSSKAKSEIPSFHNEDTFSNSSQAYSSDSKIPCSALKETYLYNLIARANMMSNLQLDNSSLNDIVYKSSFDFLKRQEGAQNKDVNLGDKCKESIHGNPHIFRKAGKEREELPEKKNSKSPRKSRVLEKSAKDPGIAGENSKKRRSERKIHSTKKRFYYDPLSNLCSREMPYRRCEAKNKEFTKHDVVENELSMDDFHLELSLLDEEISVDSAIPVEICSDDKVFSSLVSKASERDDGSLICSSNNDLRVNSVLLEESQRDLKLRGAHLVCSPYKGMLTQRNDIFGRTDKSVDGRSRFDLPTKLVCTPYDGPLTLGNQNVHPTTEETSLGHTSKGSKPPLAKGTSSNSIPDENSVSDGPKQDDVCSSLGSSLNEEMLRNIQNAIPSEISTPPEISPTSGSSTAVFPGSLSRQNSEDTEKGSTLMDSDTTGQGDGDTSNSSANEQLTKRDALPGYGLRRSKTRKKKNHLSILSDTQAKRRRMTITDLRAGTQCPKTLLSLAKKPCEEYIRSVEQAYRSSDKNCKKGQLSIAMNDHVISKTTPQEQDVGNFLKLGDSDVMYEIVKRAYGESKLKRCRAASARSLYFAAKQGHVHQVLVLAAGCNVNATIPQEKHKTAMHAAAASGHVDVLRILAMVGGNLSSLDTKLQTPLFDAVENQQTEVVKFLISQDVNLNLKDSQKMTVLHVAAQKSHIDIINLLMETGKLDVNEQDSGGWTALMWTAEGKRVDAARCLLRWGADVNVLDHEQNTCLHWAALSGDHEIMELLLEANVHVNARNMFGETALHISARERKLPNIRVLAKYRPNLEIKNADGYKAMELVQYNSKCYGQLKKMDMLMSFAKCTLKERLITRDVARGQENRPIPCINEIDEESLPNDFVYVSNNLECQTGSFDRSMTSCNCVDGCVNEKLCECTQLSARKRFWYDETGCINKDIFEEDRPLVYECNMRCKCWSTCQQRVVQRGITAGLQLYKTQEKGWAVRTQALIPKGTFVCEYVGEILTDSEANKREDDCYLFDLDVKGQPTLFCLDAKFYGNITRFINHSCDPNILPVRVFTDHQVKSCPRIAFFAARDIKPYEEICSNYGEKFWTVKKSEFNCVCNTTKCKYTAQPTKK